MWQVIDLSNGEVIDEFEVYSKAVKELNHLNRVHNPPCYDVKKATD